MNSVSWRNGFSLPAADSKQTLLHSALNEDSIPEEYEAYSDEGHRADTSK